MRRGDIYLVSLDPTVGLLRVQGGPIRKVPISMPVIRRLAGYLDCNVWDHLVFMTVRYSL